jgi:pimeloyl-ACP methyl ester carboxylesterase
MADIAGFPYFEVQFTKRGNLSEPAEKQALLAGVGQLDELFVISHGWNNDIAEARDLYRRLFANVRRALERGRAPDFAARRIGVLGVLWPSKKFADEDLIPGGGASFGGALDDDTLAEQIEGLKGTFDAPDEAVLEQAKALVPRLETDPAAREQFVDLLRSVLPEPEDTADDASDQFFELSGEAIFDLLEAPVLPGPPTGGGGGGIAAIGLAETGPPGMGGGAAGIGDFFSGVKAAARRILNYATYYQMKERAGTVGAGGLNPLLRELHAAAPELRVHLVGHSFGGRLVTAAAMGRPGSPSVAPASMTLLQAAFSHNGFAEDFDQDRDGFFREVVTAHKIAGPIAITHTKNDTAVGIAYPIASRLSREDASDLGDEDDIFGGIGRNGALARVTPEAVAGELLGQDGVYAFTAGKLHNLKADHFISGHSDVTGPEVANALLAAASPG